MTTDSPEPLDGVAPESVSPGDVDDAEIRAALSSSNPLVRQRGAAVCETLAAEAVDAVRPFFDDIASLAADDSIAVVLRAIAVLQTVAERDPGALEGRLEGLVDAVETDIADVQLTGARALGTIVVARPALVAPHARRLIAAVRATELDPDVSDFGDVVDDEVTRRTLQDHEEEERTRWIAGRRTLVNVVVAVAEAAPRSTADAVPDLVALLDDADPIVTGGAVDALGELAATNPDAVAPARDPLIDCLDHDQVVVRARAIRALGHLGDDAAVSKLRAVAAADPNGDVRELASDTADFLADAS
ncbi:HEAT repeat domain-containing protein [Halosolutus gelatinilyticus]|uniref:HEAT repeat domain-containing protein n=1 Tax=Halosolutus gelatinilyticus TaxID=2931975 RepID=UPI001FF56A1F|nr:HEAT repeat domain-containing protein [Halosolutus gelatinilyticus]